MNRYTKYCTLFAVFLLHYTARADNNDTIVVAISKFDVNGRDTTWLKHYSKNIKFVNLYNLPIRDAITALKYSNALLVTGGEDVNPAWYNKASEKARCGTLDDRRDTLEISAISIATRLEIPILGICRGEQILNVANKGSLIIDIPTDIGTKVIHNTVKDKKAMHMVKLDKKSRLYSIILQDSGMVNSFHHQCVERVAPGYSRVARSNDGIPEAIESNDIDAFIFGVQWHPEQMPETSPFSHNIGKAFIHEASRNLGSKKMKKG